MHHCSLLKFRKTVGHFEDLEFESLKNEQFNKFSKIHEFLLLSLHFYPSGLIAVRFM